MSSKGRRNQSFPKVVIFPEDGRKKTGIYQCSKLLRSRLQISPIWGLVQFQFFFNKSIVDLQCCITLVFFHLFLLVGG